MVVKPIFANERTEVGSRKGWDPMFHINTNNLMLDHSNHDYRKMIGPTDQH